MNEWSVIRQHLQWLLWGTMGLVLLAIGWMAAGRWADQRNMGFARFVPLPAVAASMSDLATSFTVSRSHASIRFSGSMRRLKAGDVSTKTFQLSSNSPSPDHRLGFFVSGDQRARPLPLLKADFVLWRDMPVEYSVQVNEKVVATGLVEELSRACFLEIPADCLTFSENNKSNDVQVALTLRCLHDCEIPAIPPALAVEYPFYTTAEGANSSVNTDSGTASEVRAYRHERLAIPQDHQLSQRRDSAPASLPEAKDADGGAN
jgi:hypothetical protein